MKIKVVGTLVHLLFTCLLFSQQTPEEGKSYERLMADIEMYQGNPKVWDYLGRYLAKAKKEGNWPQTVAAYKEMMHECDEDLRMIYADSMIIAAKKSGVNDLIGDSYLSKGIVFYQRKQHHAALDNYLTSNKYLISTKDQYLIHKLKFSMAQIKYYLGYYNEAIALFGDCKTYYRDKEKLPYLNSLHSLALCYAWTNQLNLATQTNSLAIQESSRLGIKRLLPNIELAEGIINFKKQDYKGAIRNLRYALVPIQKDGDFANEAVANFYLGKSYWLTGNTITAIGFFEKVHMAFETHGYIRPDLRENYEFLIKYYHNTAARDTELKYINGLLKTDSVLNANFHYLAQKVHKEFDTGELLAEKEKISNDLKKSYDYGKFFIVLIVLLALAVLYFIRRNRKMQRIYKGRFDSLLENGPKKEDKREPAPESLEINPAIVEGIIAKIEHFEQKRGFLKKDLTANKLAESFNTNYKYFTRVLRYHRGKNFVSYINDMRIDYLMEKLKSEPRMRNYNNAALAEEAGFSTAQHFTAAFKKRTKITLGYFVEELMKLDQ